MTDSRYDITSALSPDLATQLHAQGMLRDVGPGETVPESFDAGVWSLQSLWYLQPTYDISWPVTLVITPSALEQYAHVCFLVWVFFVCLCLFLFGCGALLLSRVVCGVWFGAWR